MLLFAVCSHCHNCVEHRATLDLAAFFDWKCPTCGATNAPAVGAEEPETQSCEECEEIVIEERDACPEDLKENILEGLL